jgi:hypothetical protein
MWQEPGRCRLLTTGGLVRDPARDMTATVSARRNQQEPIRATST